jgi:putative tryptophan/tyrosine transport system substrate-binding protein
MNRREFVTLLAGAASSPPFAASAQHSTMPVIGLLMASSPDVFADELRAFHYALKEAGYVERNNVAIEYHWAEGQLDRLPTLAAGLVRRKVAVIASFGGRAPAMADTRRHEFWASPYRRHSSPSPIV